MGRIFSIVIVVCGLPTAVVAQTASGAVVRESSPEREAATEFTFHPGLDVIAAYSVETRDIESSDSSGKLDHRFDLRRGHAWLGVGYEHAEARVLLEVARGTDEGSLFGVADDSLVAVIREAWASYEPLSGLVIEAGLVPTLVAPRIEHAFNTRALGAPMLESSQFGSPADLGARVTWQSPGDWVRLGIAAYNGEGYRSRELNRGKNLEGMLEVHPLAWPSAIRPLSILVGGTLGSTGVASAVANRLTAGLLWETPRLRTGASFTFAWGADEVPEQHGWTGELFIRGEPIERFILGARGAYLLRNTDDSKDALFLAELFAGYRVVDPLEVFIIGERQAPLSTFEASVVGSDVWSVTTAARFRVEP